MGFFSLGGCLQLIHHARIQAESATRAPEWCNAQSPLEVELGSKGGPAIVPAGSPIGVAALRT